MFIIVQNLLFLPQQTQILIKSLLRYRIHTDMCYLVETFVVSWAMKAKKKLVLHSVTNYCGTNLSFYDINDLILDIRGSIFLPATSTTLQLYDQQVLGHTAFEFKIAIKLLGSRAYTAIFYFLQSELKMYVVMRRNFCRSHCRNMRV